MEWADDSREKLRGADLVQLFVTNENQLRFLSIRICTYQRRNAGSLLLTLQRRLPQPRAPGRRFRGSEKSSTPARVRLGLAPPPPPDWEELARVTVPCDELVDNETIEFPVGSVDTSQGDLLAFKIMASGTSPARRRRSFSATRTANGSRATPRATSPARASRCSACWRSRYTAR